MHLAPARRAEEIGTLYDGLSARLSPSVAEGGSLSHRRDAKLRFRPLHHLFV